MKKYLFILVIAFFATRCADKIDSSKTENTSNNTIDLFLSYAETPDVTFCSPDSIIGGDAGNFGQVYFTPKGNVIWTYACMGCDSGSYFWGKYTLTDSTLSFKLTGCYSYATEYNDTASTDNTDYSKGVVSNIDGEETILRVSKFPNVKYYLPYTKKEIEELSKNNDMRVSQGIIYYLNDTEERKAYETEIYKKISVLKDL